MNKEALIAKIKTLEAPDFVRDPVTRKFVEKMRPPYVFEREGKVFVSAEDGCFFADYYGEFRGGYPWIDPKLEELAKEFKGYWEWENPGCIFFVEN